MAIWDNTTKTEKGLALDQKLMAMSLPLRIKSAVSGSGSVNPTQLVKQTEVLQPQQELNLRQSFLTSDGTAVIPVELSNKGLVEGYSLFQVGLFAEDPDEGDVLYIIAQTALTGGEVVPSESETASYSITWNFGVKGSLAASMEVVVGEAGSMSVDQGQYKTNLLPAGEEISDEDTLPMYDADAGKDVKVTAEQIKEYVRQDMATRTVKIESILYADRWDQDAKTYSFEADYPGDQFDIDVEYANTCTEDQVYAWCVALLAGSKSDNLLTAIGDVPTMDIPIYITVTALSGNITAGTQTEIGMLALGDDDTGYYAEIDNEDNNIENIVNSDDELTVNNYSLEIL